MTTSDPSKSAPDSVTLVRGAVHNPKEPRHFMRVKPVPGRVRVFLGQDLLADSVNALRVLEAGRDLYDPVIYFPMDDVSAALTGSEKSTRCPIKGRTAYFHVVGENGVIRAEDLAWSYVETIPEALALQDRIAFDPARTAMLELPAGQAE